MKRTCFMILITGLMFIAGGCAGQEPESPQVEEPGEKATEAVGLGTGVETLAEEQADPQAESESPAVSTRRSRS